jgi:hypothetical protein
MAGTWDPSKENILAFFGMESKQKAATLAIPEARSGTYTRYIWGDMAHVYFFGSVSMYGV